MTPTEQRLYAQMTRQAASMGPEMRTALLALFDAVRGSLSDAELLRLLRVGDTEALVQTFLDVLTSDATTARFRTAMRRGYERTARASIATLPLPRAAQVTVAFDWLNPRIVEAVRTLESRALGTLTTDTAEVVRQVVRGGIARGVNPRALIPELRQSIGLAPAQEGFVANYRRALESGDFAKARGYLNRDKSFDRRLKAGQPLTPDEIDRLTDRYRARWRAQNAETQARTAALDASRAGQRASWESAVSSGAVERGRLTKRWVATLDARVRPTHRDANGTTVPFDALFPVDGGVMVPGENTYNCRCIAVYKVTAR